MIDLSQIRQSYPQSLQKFDRGLLREYLQYQILALIFDHPVSKKLSFLGGTCLRMVHGLPRFFEDIDFDNKDLSEAEFRELSEYLERELEQRGYRVELRFISKGALHCYIKFPGILYEQGLSKHTHEKILIQVDTFDQGVMYEPERYILNRFEFFEQIRVTPATVILSQKLWTITQRTRLKGRDFYDIMFLLQRTSPDGRFLQAKFGERPVRDIVKEILGELREVDFSALADDVRPFLFEPAKADRLELFVDVVEQELLR